MKNKLVLVVAVLVGILAFGMSYKYLKDTREELYKGADTVKVIVAKQDLAAETILTIDDLALDDVFKSAVGQNAFREKDLGLILGKRLKYQVRREDPLMWSQVDIPRRTRGGLAPVVTKGKRALSLSVSGASAVSGLVKPNDHVDIIGTFTFPSRLNPKMVESVTLTLMQNVTVLATGSQLARQGSGESKKSQSGGYSSMTFEVSPREVEILVFAQQTRGQLYLSLRNPEDIYAEGELPSINFDYLESRLQELNDLRQQSVRSASPLNSRP